MKVIGGLGGIYVYASFASSTLTFADNDPSADTITDSAGLLLTSGLVVGMPITVSGTDSNDGSYTIAELTATVITLAAADELAAEAEGDAVTIASAVYGYQLLGFKNWSGTNGIDKVDASCYEDYPYKTHITTLKDWTATIDGYWLSTERSSWLGRTLALRLYHRFTASPTATAPAIYWSGDGIIEGIPEGVPYDALITESFTVQGNGLLTEAVKTDAWY